MKSRGLGAGDGVACLLMAAGLSRRMGGESKLLLPASRGETVFERSLKACIGGGYSRVVVVTGHESHAITSLARSLGAPTVINQDFHRGLHSSIRHGVIALSEDTKAWADELGFVVALADMPRLQASHHDLARTAFVGAAISPRLTRPTDGVRFGHPVGIHRAFAEEILAEPDSDTGCGYLFNRHPEARADFRAEDSAFYDDVDDPESYARWFAGLES